MSGAASRGRARWSRWIVSAARALAWTASATLVAATLLPLLRGDAWWVRVFDFPRAPLALAAAGLLAWAIARRDARPLRRWALVATLFVVAAEQIRHLWPYTPLHSAQMRAAAECPDDSRLRLLTVNVLQSNRRAEALLAQVAGWRPDVVLALETDRWWDARLAVLAADYPHAVRRPQDNTYGLTLYSRLALEDARVRFVLDDDVPSVWTGLRLPSGARLALRGVHPRPPRPGIDTVLRDAELLAIGIEAGGNERATVMMGDFNDVPWSRTVGLFRALSGLTDPRIGRALLPTFHAVVPVGLWPLDHVLAGGDLALIGMRRLPDVGSDHFPLLVDLCHRPRAVSDLERAGSQAARARALRAIRAGLDEAAGTP